jgi:uncharacterized membrane protein
MIEIIPNIHPIFVHFTVALFSTSVGFYTLAYLLPKFRLFPKLASDFEVVARWCLWVVGIMVIVTVLAGLQAFNTVRHDAPSHLAMTDHRNWAVPTACAMVLVALWSLWRAYKRKAITLIFILALFIVQGLLLSTAWRGAELVFRYGLGVMSLPQAEGEGHNHKHMEGMKEDSMGSMDHSTMPPMENHEHSDHQHGHAE